MRIIILFLLSIAFNVTANILIKVGMTHLKELKLEQAGVLIQKMILNPALIFGCLCYGLSLLFYTFILQKINLNIAYPIVISGTVLLITVISSFILMEPLKFTNIIGIFVILSGIFLVLR